MKMLDSGGRQIEVEGFHVSFRGGLGQRHIIGIREHTDLPAEAREGHENLGVPGALCPRDPQALVLCATSLTRLFSALGDKRDAAALSEVTVALAYDAATFEVVGCTAAWARAFSSWPLAAGDSVHGWLKQPDNEKLLRDCNYAVNTILNAEGEGEGEFVLRGMLILRPRTAARRGNVEVQAEATVTFSLDDASDSLVAFVVLTQPRIRELRASCSGSSVRSSVQSSASSFRSSQHGTARVPTARGTIGVGAVVPRRTE